MKKALVKCGSLTYNGNKYFKGSIIEIEENLSSIKALLQFGDLEIVSDQTEKIEAEPQAEQKDPKQLSKKELQKIAKELELDVSKKASTKELQKAVEGYIGE